MVRVLLPVDFSASSLRACEVAVFFARQFDAEIDLVHVVESPLLEITPYHFAVPDSVWDDLRERAREQLEAQRQKIAAEGVRVEAHLRHGVPDQAICDVAEQSSADLIVMGTHGRTGLAHVLLGSVAERTLRRASCPVLTVKE